MIINYSFTIVCNVCIVYKNKPYFNKCVEGCLLRAKQPLWLWTANVFRATGKIIYWSKAESCVYADSFECNLSDIHVGHFTAAENESQFIFLLTCSSVLNSEREFFQHCDAWTQALRHRSLVKPQRAHWLKGTCSSCYNSHGLASCSHESWSKT